MDLRRVRNVTSGPYRSDQRARSLASTYARNDIAGHLVKDVTRRPPSEEATALAAALEQRRTARIRRGHALQDMKDNKLVLRG